jgi:hypothetical protein
MKRELVFTHKETEDIIPLEDKALEKSLKENFDFEIGYIPEGFGTAFLLLEDNKEDSRKDKWRIAFYKPTVDFGEKTVTLDNADEVKEGSIKIEFYKVVDGNFEDVINLSVDIIKKYYNDIKNNESTV